MSGKVREVLVVGAGPGGLQLGYFLARRGRSFTVLERAHAAGSFFGTFPRHRRLISVNKVHTGHADERRMRFDWNSLLGDGEGSLFSRYSEEYFPHADAMVAYLRDFAARHVPSIEFGCDVRLISKEEGLFHLDTADGRRFSARTLVVATGVTSFDRPGIRGLDLATSYGTFDTDAERYVGRRVLIIGKGNSAFETADAIVHKAALIHLASPSPIRMAWNTHYPGHLRAVNNNFLDTYQLKLQNALLDATVTSLRPADAGRIIASFAYSHAGGEIEDIVYDDVIACTGFAMDLGPFAPGCRPATMLDGRFPALMPDFESTNVPGLYFAGTLTQSLDYRKSNSAFIHGFRYNARALALILENKLHGVPLPCHTEPLDVERLCDRIIRRINRSSALWQQFGFIGDAVVLRGEAASYFEDLPVPYIHFSRLGRADLYAIVTLEFGAHDGDVFAIRRAPEVGAADRSFFLHPVIRVFSRGVLVRTHHLLENLFGEWEHPHLHRRPLLEFLTVMLRRDSSRRFPSARGRRAASKERPRAAPRPASASAPTRVPRGGP